MADSANTQRKDNARGNHHSVLIARYNLKCGPTFGSEVPLIENRV